MSSAAYREYAPGDFVQVTGLLEAELPHEGATGMRFVRQVLNDPDTGGGGTWIAERGGNVVGFVHSVHRETPLDGPLVTDADRGYIVLLAVSATVQRTGVGSALLRKAEEHLAARGSKEILVGPCSPNYFAPGVGTEYGSGLAFFPAHGYSEVSRPLAMKVSLRPVAFPEWVPKIDLSSIRIVVRPWIPELTGPLLSFARKRFGPDWARFVRDAVRDITEGDDPLRLVNAVDLSRGDYHVVGFSHYQGQRFGPIGVDPEYRGKGIGQVLCHRTLLAQAEQGSNEAFFLWSDDRTADRLYNGFGFKEQRRFVLFRKEL